MFIKWCACSIQTETILLVSYYIFNNFYCVQSAVLASIPYWTNCERDLLGIRSLMSRRIQLIYQSINASCHKSLVTHFSLNRFMCR